MPFYIQHDADGNITGTVFGERAPEHPNQIELPEPVDLTDKRIVKGEIVVDEGAIAAREKRNATQDLVYDLAAQKLDELVAGKPDNWDELSVFEKAEIHSGG